MTEQLTAITAFLAQTGMTVYTAGCVPGNAQLPYLVYSWKSEAFPKAGTVTVDAWFAEENGSRDRAAFSDRLVELVPDGGCMAGRLWVCGRTVTPETSLGALGVRTVFRVIDVE